jgi:HEAT repeat protein
MLRPILLCLVLLAAAAQPGASEKRSAAPADLERALLARDCAALDTAIQAIQTTGVGTAAVAALRVRLGHTDPGVRRLAAYALSQIDPDGARRAIPALMEALHDGEPRVRARVALALAYMGPAAREAAPALTDLLKDPSPRARAGAARALSAIAPDAPATVVRLAELLKDTEPPVRGTAATALGQLGTVARDAVPALRSVATTDPEATVRAAAAGALEEFDPSPQTLAQALKAPDPGRRLWAVAASTAKGAEARGVAPDLLAVVKHDESVKVRAGAALALGKIGADPGLACPVLVEALHDPAPRVRTAAALALGLFGPGAQGAGPALAAALRNEDAEVTSAAATALGNLGPRAEPAVPLLIDLLRQDRRELRLRAVAVLGRIGPAAQAAGPALAEVTTDRDPALRREALRALVTADPQARVSVAALLEGLRCADSELDRNVRAWASLSLGRIGPPAAEAVPQLVKALEDSQGSVRSAASLALGQIGAQAVPALVKALDHVDPRVRAGAAHALGVAGSAARRAVPALRQALRDEDAWVRFQAGTALGRIAEGLQLAQDTPSLANLEETLQALEGVQTSQLSGESRVAWMSVVEKVREAVGALRTVRRASFLDRLFHRPWFLVLAGVVLYVSVLLLVWSILLRLRPLWLLRINDALRSFPRVVLPGPLGGVELSLRGLLLVGFFHYHRRVLDAWVGRHAGPFRASFEARRTVKDRAVYVPMPVILDGQVVACLTVAPLGKVFAGKRGCLLIWGEGGSGKTSLACQVGRWALAADRAERLCNHVMLPVLIEHELEPRAADGKPAFLALTEAVRGQLQALIGGAAPLAGELLEQLLLRRRILVLVDHLSEASAAARAAVHPGHADFPALALVVTSRTEEALDGVPKSTLQPLRIEGNRLSSFMEAYLVQRGKRQLFDDAEYFEACRGLSLLAGARPITALLAKLYAEQMIARKESWPEGSLPTSLPDLILGYLNELNRAVVGDQRRSDFEVQRDAEALAWECLRQGFRPEPVSLEAAVEALGGADAQARLSYLEEQLKVVRLAEPARDRVAFTLDPLAEHLAALHVVNKNRGEPALWRDFMARAAALAGKGESDQGFLRAVRECCLARKAAAGVVELLDQQLGRTA